MLKRVALSLLIATLVSSPPTLALEDAASGLSVDLPAGFSAEITQRPSYQVTIGVISDTGTPATSGANPYLCEIGFQGSPDNAALTQDEINQTVGTADWIAMVETTLEPAFSLLSATSFTLAGANGAEFIGTPKAGPESLNVRVFLSMLETPKGRTAISCATTAAQIDSAVEVFRTVRQSVTPPA